MDLERKGIREFSIIFKLHCKLNLFKKKRHWTLPREAEAHYSHSLKI